MIPAVSAARVSRGPAGRESVVCGELFPRTWKDAAEQTEFMPLHAICLLLYPVSTLIEGIRKRENNWCCGAGRGARDAFPDFALWTASQKLIEVKEVGAEVIAAACPYCKENLAASAALSGDNIRVFDISEIIAEAIGK